MPMGICAIPAQWQSYISAILIGIPNRSKYLAIMDDLLLHSSKHSHLKISGIFADSTAKDLF